MEFREYLTEKRQKFVVTTKQKDHKDWVRVKEMIQKADPDADFGKGPTVEDTFFSVTTKLSKQDLLKMKPREVFIVMG